MFAQDSHILWAVNGGVLNTFLFVSALDTGRRIYMKRIAAIIGTSVALLAIPATAMASTTGSAGGPGNPGWVTSSGPGYVTCRLPHGIRIRVSGSGQASGSGTVTVTPVPVNGKPRHIRCSVRKRPALPVQVCVPGTVTFSMPPNGDVFTEYSGPQLYTGEQFSYGGTNYNVATVSASVFTLTESGSGFTNGGQSVVDGSATVSCAGVAGIYSGS
jgi:hypothetical protein